ncbi:MAG: HAD family hydrolase [Candidatus Fermentibacteria bacterium]|nr:HAD family hydrolase [Candidatus Fermentibacteria bacterium]
MITKNAKFDKTKLWIFDADDTLWESGLYFRRAEEDFTALMHSLGFDPEEIRSEIHRRDIERLSATGYGARPYMDTLRLILKEKSHALTPYMLASLDYISNCLLHHPLVLLPGVLDSLNRMFGAGKRMIVYTMGEEDHQIDKFNRSGISEYFEQCTVVALKTKETMIELLAAAKVDPAEACMIGNSPRSDINPAIGCGVNAVYLQRPHTWLAEQTEFAEPGLVTTVAGLPDILPLAGLV